VIGTGPGSIPLLILVGHWQLRYWANNSTELIAGSIEKPEPIGETRTWLRVRAGTRGSSRDKREKQVKTSSMKMSPAATCYLHVLWLTLNRKLLLSSVRLR